MPRQRPKVSQPKLKPRFCAYRTGGDLAAASCEPASAALAKPMSEGTSSGLSLVLASRNAGKLAEFATLSVPFNWRLQSEFVQSQAHETGQSCIENALIKARFASMHSGLPAVGDDSGFFVPALGGLPGLFSARFAGEPADDVKNAEKLQQLARDLPAHERKAFYACSLAFVRHAEDPMPLVVTVQWAGELLTEPRGRAGYGYDALFYLPELGKTVAELSFEQKMQLSNRRQALVMLVEQMKAASVI
jgi:XTP/dITP diphosphohydrolase